MYKVIEDGLTLGQAIDKVIEFDLHGKTYGIKSGDRVLFPTLQTNGITLEDFNSDLKWQVIEEKERMNVFDFIVYLKSYGGSYPMVECENVKCEECPLHKETNLSKNGGNICGMLVDISVELKN